MYYFPQPVCFRMPGTSTLSYKNTTPYKCKLQATISVPSVHTKGSIFYDSNETLFH